MEVRDAATAAAEEAMSRSAEVVRERHNSGMYFSDQVSTSGVQIVDISYDGTWHKRGYSSHYGVGAVVDNDSGLILDTHTESNYYRGCDKAPPLASFTAWNESHKKSCNKNFDGTSNAMEVEAAAVIFARSVRQRKLIYGTMLCDGDSKALDNVNRLAIYDINHLVPNVPHMAQQYQLLKGTITLYKYTILMLLNELFTFPSLLVSFRFPLLQNFNLLQLPVCSHH